jgi:hypothetical protein
MTFAEAIEAARTGVNVKRPSWGDRWMLFRDRGGLTELHTQTPAHADPMPYVPVLEDVTATDWEATA